MTTGCGVLPSMTSAISGTASPGVGGWQHHRFLDAAEEERGAGREIHSHDQRPGRQAALVN